MTAEREQFQEVILKLLHQNGFENEFDMDIGDYLRIDGGEAFMPLCIERIFDSHLSVMHTWKQNGDVMRDPEIVFDISQDPWVPVQYRQDPYTHQRDDRGISGLDEFLATWSTNIQHQGFFERSSQVVG